MAWCRAEIGNKAENGEKKARNGEEWKNLRTARDHWERMEPLKEGFGVILFLPLWVIFPLSTSSGGWDGWW